MPHEKWGERPIMLVVLKEDYRGSILEDDLKSFLAEFLEKGVITKWTIPDRIIFVDSLPKTSVGKLYKKVIRQQVSGGITTS